MAYSSSDYTVDGSVDKIVNWKDKYNALVNVVVNTANDDSTLKTEVDNIGVYNDFKTAFDAAKT
jgi:hypothetical protein